MTLQAWLTLPSCLASSSSPTLPRITSCSRVIVTSAQWTLPVRTSGSEAHHFTPVCQIKPIPLQFSALGEFLWYLIKDNQLDFILPYISAYADDSDDGLTVHGGYGPRIFDQRGHDQ